MVKIIIDTNRDPLIVRLLGTYIEVRRSNTGKNKHYSICAKIYSHDKDEDGNPLYPYMLIVPFIPDVDKAFEITDAITEILEQYKSNYQIEVTLKLNIDNNFNFSIEQSIKQIPEG